MDEHTLQQLKEVFDPFERRVSEKIAELKVEVKGLRKDSLESKVLFAKMEERQEHFGRDLNGAWTEIRSVRNDTATEIKSMQKEIKPQKWSVGNWLYIVGLVIAISIALLK